MFFPVCTVVTRLVSVLAILANLCLIPLIWYRSTRELGTYRYLLLAYTFVSLFFSGIVIVGAPIFGPSQQGWILYASSANMPQSHGWWIVVLYCFCYVAELLVLALSFVYRYFYVCRIESLVWFRNPCRVTILVIGFWVVATIWTGATVVYLRPNEQLNDIFALSVYNNSKLEISNVSYIAGIAFKDGQLVLSFFLIFLMRVTVIGSSAITVMFCAIRTGLSLRHVNYGNVHKRTSQRAQRRLFYLLIVQTIVPVMLIYIPALSSYAIAFFRFDAPNLTMFYTILMPVAQFVDPVMIILFVRDYRRPAFAITRGILNMINRRLRQRVSDCVKIRY